MQSPPLLTGPLSIGEILDRAIRFYRTYFRMLILAPALFLAPLAIINLIVQATAQPYEIFRLHTLSNNPASIFRLLNAAGGNSRSVLILVSIQFILANFITLVVTVQCIHLWHGKTLPLKQSIVQGARYLWSYFRIYCLIALVMVGIVIVTFILLFIAALARFPIRSMIPLAIAFMLITSLPFFVRWQAISSALVAEALGPIEAMRRSRALTHGLYWRTLTFLLVSLLLTFIITLSPIFLVNLLAAIFAPDSAAHLLASAKSVIQGMTSIVMLPLATAIHVLYYYDLRARQEGYDVGLQVERMEHEVFS